MVHKFENSIFWNMFFFFFFFFHFNRQVIKMRNKAAYLGHFRIVMNNGGEVCLQ